MSEILIRGLGPESETFFDVLLPQIDDGMLREIAAADYARDEGLHLVPLKLFFDKRTLPVLDWHPAEVLELIRWSEPDLPNWKPGGTGMRGHLMRAFACALLLRSYERPENRDKWLSLNETVLQLCNSIRTLGNPFLSSGIGFLTWCAETLTPLDAELEAPFLNLALLSLAVESPNVADANIIALCDKIEAQVSALLPEWQWAATRKKNWLLSINHHDLRNEQWIELGRRLYGLADAQRASEKWEKVGRIGRLLAED